MAVMRISALVILASCLVSCAGPSEFAGTSAREDPHLRFVTVDEGVQLEVIDWGGWGRAVVLLAGSGNTAHVFDQFAPRLADRWHTYAITPPSVRTSFEAYRASQVSNTGWAFPATELRQVCTENADGSVGSYKASTAAIHSAIGRGQKKRDYSRIRVPILALSTFASSPASGGDDRCIEHSNDRPRHEPKDAAELAVIEQFESLEAAYI
jgi:hypothetical protein